MLRPGWLVALCAAALVVSAWLPWLSTSGGRANAIGGTVGNLALPARFGAGQLIVLLAAALIVAGAMSARGLSPRAASAAAVALSLLLVGMTVWYYRLNVRPPVAAAYGLYVGSGVAVAALVFSGWAMVGALSRRNALPRR
jgi:fucose 4-O-acetylase-like acetyltransferase